MNALLFFILESATIINYGRPRKTTHARKNGATSVFREEEEQPADVDKTSTDYLSTDA